VLLVGCQSAVEPTPPPPPPAPWLPSLSVEVSGPSRIDATGSFSWEVLAFGGDGEYHYRWEATRQAGQQLASTALQQPIPTSTDRTLSLLVADTDGDLLLRLTVTSGRETQVKSMVVRNCIAGCAM
jgi:hypothetical protein